MERFTVNQLAKLAGVSVRTLHHYDDIGLLKPGERTESNYRYYGREELLRLQQILFYKEMDLPLAKIAEILDDPAFDTKAALKSHKEELLKRRKRTEELLKTIDKTLKSLSQNSKLKKMKAEDMYSGFDKEQLKAYEKEATEKYGSNIMAESKERMNKMGKEGLEKLLAEGEEISRELVLLMHLKPEDKKVQAVIDRHYKMIGNFYTVTPEIYRGLSDLYVSDERFKKNYEKHKEGLAEFLSAGMIAYSERNFKN